MIEELDALADRLGWDFQDRSLLFHSLVHRSHLNENPGTHLRSNERLEFLGDAILDALAAEFLFLRCPDLGEGDLTLWRSALVRTETLAAFAAQLDLGRYLVMGRGEETDGGRSRTTILADAFEAVLGAVYLDGGVTAARAFFTPFMEGAMTSFAGRLPIDYKSALQIEVQGRAGITPQYRTVAASGPDHARTFQVEVWAGERLLGQGEGLSKQAAQQEAARAALELMTVDDAPAPAVEEAPSKRAAASAEEAEPALKRPRAARKKTPPQPPAAPEAAEPTPPRPRAARKKTPPRPRAARKQAEKSPPQLPATAAEPALKRPRAARKQAEKSPPQLPAAPEAAEPSPPRPRAARKKTPPRPRAARKQAEKSPPQPPATAPEASPPRPRAARKKAPPRPRAAREQAEKSPPQPPATAAEAAPPRPRAARKQAEKSPPQPPAAAEAAALAPKRPRAARKGVRPGTGPEPQEDSA